MNNHNDLIHKSGGRRPSEQPSTMSDRQRRRIVNRLAQARAAAYNNEVKRRLQAELDNAEMRCVDDSLLISWQREIERAQSAGTCTH